MEILSFRRPKEESRKHKVGVTEILRFALNDNCYKKRKKKWLNRILLIM